MYRLKNNLLSLLYISILEESRRQGFARKVIEKLLEVEGVFEIYGDAVPNSIEFWKSVGGDFEGEEDSLETYIEEDSCIPFFIIKQ
mgnify:FL=1